MSLIIFFGQPSGALTAEEIGEYLRLSQDYHRVAVSWRQKGHDPDSNDADSQAFTYRELARAADPGMTALAWADEPVPDSVMQTYFSERFGWTAGGAAPVPEPPLGSADMSATLQEFMRLHREGMEARRIPDNTTAHVLLTEAQSLLATAAAADPARWTSEWELFDYDEIVAFYAAYL